jgi:hypothetical protein
VKGANTIKEAMGEQIMTQFEKQLPTKVLAKQEEQ